MAFAQFEDFSGMCELIIFPRTYKRIEQWLEGYSVFIIKGALDLSSDKKCKIKVNELVPVELLFEHWPTIENCTLDLPTGFDQEAIEKVSSGVKGGKTSLNFLFHENGMRLRLRSKKKIACDNNLVDTLSNLGIKILLSL